MQNSKKIRNINKRHNEKKEVIVEDKVAEKKFCLKKVLKEYFKFYKQKLMRKHIIVYIICLVIFFVMIASFTSKINSTPNMLQLIENAKDVSDNSTGIFSLIFSKKITLIFMIIFAGIAPYFFIPVIGVFSASSLATDIVSNFNILTGKGSIISMCIGAIIELIAVCLAIATGIQYCILSTKKWRYSRNQDYSMKDFKRTFYEATNNKKKLNEINKKIQEKNKKNEKNNVSIPYIYLLISFIISSVIIAIGTIIAGV